MSETKRYGSVTELLRQTTEAQFAQELEARLARRKLAKMLAVLRTTQGLSQQELAQKFGCTQSKISKMENGEDASINFGDLMQYMDAVNHRMHIILMPKDQKLVDEVKLHAFLIKRILDKLVRLAQEDKTITKGVAEFFAEVACNVTRLVQHAAKALPMLVEEPCSSVKVEAPEISDEESLREGEEEAGGECRDGGGQSPTGLRR